MKNSKFSICSTAAAVAALCLILCLTSCAPGFVTPLFQDKEFASMHITEPIYLLPVVDMRVNKTKKLNLESNAMNRLSPAFEKKGYAPLKAERDRKWVEHLVEDDFTRPDSTFLATLGPENARFLFCAVLHDFKSTITFGSTANAEISGYIVDKNRGKIVWRHKGVGQAGQGGFVGMAMKGMVEQEAANNALMSLAKALPRNGGPIIAAAKK